MLCRINAIFGASRQKRFKHETCIAFRGKTTWIAATKSSFTNRDYATILPRMYRHGVQTLRVPNVSVVNEIVRWVAAARNDRLPAVGKISRKARVGNGRQPYLSCVVIFYKTIDIKRPLFENKKLCFSYIFDIWCFPNGNLFFFTDNTLKNGDRRCVDETICTSYKLVL